MRKTTFIRKHRQGQETCWECAELWPCPEEAWERQDELSFMLRAGRQHKQWLVDHAIVVNVPGAPFSRGESMAVQYLIRAGMPERKAIQIVLDARGEPS